MKNTLNSMPEVGLITKFQQNPHDSSVTEILLNKYEPLIKKLAFTHTEKHPSITLEDATQSAIVGAMLAFRRFSPHPNCAPFTFIYKTIYYYLLSCADEEAFVKCPSNLRSTRHKYPLLNSETIIVTDSLPEIIGDGENNIIDGISHRLFLDSLSQEDSCIARMLFEGHSQTQISKIMAKTPKQISAKVNAIKQKLVQYSYEC